MSDDPSSWRPAVPGIALGADDIHCWRASLDATPETVASFAATLSPDERERAARFRAPADGDRFTVGRGILRAILAGYLGIEPGALRFIYGAHGKPALVSGDNAKDIRFNLSHSRGLALFAFALGREIGADLEFMRPNLDTERLAVRFFSREEIRTLQALPDAERRAAFFRCWSRKEAFIKARGEGLSLPLDGFTVSLAPGAAAALLHVAADEAEARRWELREIPVAADYAAAIAAEGANWSLALWDWSSPLRR